jgi:adenine-specific DNA-methyltransferase
MKPQQIIDHIDHTTDKRAELPTELEGGNENQDYESGMYQDQIDRSTTPHLVWLTKTEQPTVVETKSVYVKEEISPQNIIDRFYTYKDNEQNLVQNLFANTPDANTDALKEVLKRPLNYYQHEADWRNRMILGDSLYVMNSLLQKENMTGKVQMIYFDPPYGIKFNSNWQKKIGDKNVTDGKDEHITHEPEQIKAFRDTWEYGIHSYLTYIRDRLLVAKDLLTESGSIFFQISDENVHLVRCLLDEVFGSENFVVTFAVKKKGSQKSELIDPVNDYVIWYSKSSRYSNNIKFYKLFDKRILNFNELDGFKEIELSNGDVFKIEGQKINGIYYDTIEDFFSKYPDAKLRRADPLISGGERKNQSLPFIFNGQTYHPSKGNCWKTTVRNDDGSVSGMESLVKKNRIIAKGTLYYKRYHSDFEYKQLQNWWDNLGGASNPMYIVQTNETIIQRCILMSTDPGDLVLDPTCGSGTTAYVAEKWGRRWITIDTSRIALNIAKTRIATAVFPYYWLSAEADVIVNQKGGDIDKKIAAKEQKQNLSAVEKMEFRDIKQGFVYKEVPHVTLGSIANNEPPETETLFDKPYEDTKRMRVAGAFTVETLQNYNPKNFDEVAKETTDSPAAAESRENFMQKVFFYMQENGVRPSTTDKPIKFIRFEPYTHKYLHAIGYYEVEGQEKTAYCYVGDRFSTVGNAEAAQVVNAARSRKDCDWLLLLGFAFESTVENDVFRTSTKEIEMTKVQMHHDLLQDGHRKKATSTDAFFVAIGEPDIDKKYSDDKKTVVIEVLGLDIYDPFKNILKPRERKDIAYIEIDDDYNGRDFVVRQMLFCGGSGKEFEKMQKNLVEVSTQFNKTKKNVEQVLKMEIDHDIFEQLYGYNSFPITVHKKDGKSKTIAVKIISHFGEEVTKVLYL